MGIIEYQNNFNPIKVIYILLKFVILFSLVNLFIKDILTTFIYKEINIGNPVKYYENSLNFSEYSTTIKPIAIYKLDFNIIDNKQNINIADKQLDKENIKIKLEDDINFAKNHGIYGFAFYYSLFPEEKKVSHFILDIIIQNNKFQINFFIIIEKEKTEIDIYNLFSYLIKYVEDKRYIKIYNKYVIGINKENFTKKDIRILRESFKKHNLRKIFILSRTNNYKRNNYKKNYGLCYSPSFKKLQKIIFYYNKTIGYFYTHLIYYNLLKNPLKNSNIFRMSEPMSKYPIFIDEKKTYIYLDYSPEKFYFLNKIIMNWTKIYHRKKKQYIFINNFNNLKKDNILGYANINSFEKALYNLPLIDINKKFNIFELEKKVMILIQVHIYYTDLLAEIINKTNNIPVPFDLYITTDNHEKKIYINKNLKIYSKANKFRILITPNKGRDVIPCLIQLKDILKKYKYLCHIHTKKHGINVKFGIDWQHYLYENLLGNKFIIKQILSDFENHSELGFIFPEHFYATIIYAYKYKNRNFYLINKIFDILFPNMKLKAGNIMNFPVGNMFWARTDAIYQIFDERIIKLAPEEKGQKDKTILHAIERFWLYLVKLNGFNYKTILYYI